VRTPERSDGGYRLSIDHSLCSGSGHCSDIAPEAFEIIDHRSWPASDLDFRSSDHNLIQQAARACPWFAISFVAEKEGEGR
jgi:ferredoxin